MVDLTGKHWSIVADGAGANKAAYGSGGAVLYNNTLYFTFEDKLLGFDTKTGQYFKEATLVLNNRRGHPVIVDDNIYVISRDEPVWKNREVRIWNINNKTWTTGPSMLNARGYFTPFLYDNKIYAIGPGKDSEVLDLSTNTWSALAPRTRDDSSAYCCVVNGKAYVFSANKLEIYDIAANTWSVGRDLPGTSISNTKGAAYGDEILLVVRTPYPDNLFVYNTTTDTYRRLIGLHSTSTGFSTLMVVNDILYHIGYPSNSDGGFIYAISLTSAPEALDYVPELGVAPTDTSQLAIHQDISKNADYTWTTADSAVATVDGAGLLTAVAPGKTKATVSSGGFGYQQSMTVYVPEP